jgi:high affinity Mn2+ porin
MKMNMPAARCAPLILACIAACAFAQQSGEEDWAIYGQATNVTQKAARFRSPYQGPNSLNPNGHTEATNDVTLYAGWRLGPATEVWINPEIDQGRGLSDTLGMAGFPSGEAYKVGANAPYLRIPRLFVRHVISLGQAREQLEPEANQLGGTRVRDNIILTIGKFAATDIFDTNTYAHDPRADFLNWSVIDAGTFDYAADPWGYTYGLAAEWNESDITARAGIFQLSPVPNSKITAIHFGQYMLVAEFEQRYVWQNHPGKIKLLAFANKANMARYDDAVRFGQTHGTTPDVAAVRRPGWRPGISINFEQELTPDIGVFARAGINDGSKEAYEFTEINRTLAAGVAIRGTQWGRPGDTVGIAAVINGLSSEARAYFERGGLGILIGDGALSYGHEKIIEAYYSSRLNKWLSVSFDFQHARNPAYNRSRGPVPIYALRLHAQF